jgi:hypothetical protein
LSFGKYFGLGVEQHNIPGA